MWRISRETEEALWSAAKQHLSAGALRRKALVAAIGRRSELYTLERDELEFPSDLGDAGDLAARALFFTPADAAKIKIPLAELANRSALPTARPLRVLDVGAGCGAMTLGIAEALPHALEVVAVDRDSAALELFTTAAKELGRSELALDTRRGDVSKLRGVSGEFDVIACGSVLNELSESKATALALDLLSRLSQDGVLIVIEPALRLTSRRLHRLRDRVIEDGLGNIFAPCTRESAPCPALALERDWCHEDRTFEATPRLAALTNATGMRARRLKFSYLVVSREAHALAPRAGMLRVVSSLKKTKGQSELFACGEDGRNRLRLQKRDRTAQNRGFEKARRGQLLEVGEGTFALMDPSKVS